MFTTCKRANLFILLCSITMTSCSLFDGVKADIDTKDLPRTAQIVKESVEKLDAAFPKLDPIAIAAIFRAYQESQGKLDELEKKLALLQMRPLPVPNVNLANERINLKLSIKSGIPINFEVKLLSKSYSATEFSEQRIFSTNSPQQEEYKFDLTEQILSCVGVIQVVCSYSVQGDAAHPPGSVWPDQPLGIHCELVKTDNSGQEVSELRRVEASNKTVLPTGQKYDLDLGQLLASFVPFANVSS